MYTFGSWIIMLKLFQSTIGKGILLIILFNTFVWEWVILSNSNHLSLSQWWYNNYYCYSVSYIKNLLGSPTKAIKALSKIHYLCGTKKERKKKASCMNK